MIDESAGNHPRRGIPRRALLLSAAAAGITAVGAATVGVTAGATNAGLNPPALRNAQGAPSGAGTSGPTGGTTAGQGGVTTAERVYSAARRRKVDFVTVLPDGEPPAGLPMCVLLHGLNSDARSISAGLGPILAAAVARGATSPYGFVAVDGGDSYWHGNHIGDDPMAMLLDEVPRWLADRGLGGEHGTPFAVSGFSMGGFGSFLYARRRAERRDPVDAVAVVAPALLTSWTEMAKRNAFHNAADWASMDPLKNLDHLGGAPIGLWSGDRDRFITGSRQFIGKVHPQVGSVTPGLHTSDFLHKVTPEVVRFLGKYVPGAPPIVQGPSHVPAN